MATSSRGEFGDFLRSRREKVAELAGIGVDWYVWLEQGRTVSPSDATLDALASALRLGKVEAAHLRALARNGDRRDFAPESVPPVIERLVTSLNLPAYVAGRRWDIPAWNAAAADVLGFDRLDASNRNILAFMFIETDSRRLFGRAWTDEARRMVALFRATHDLHAGDPAFIELVERVRAHSPEFTKWWNAHYIRGGTSGQKVLTHPERGAQRYEYATFQANDDPALRLSIYTPV
ncbi:helix-turn-helix transcriptional regulator [Paraburkholderia sediminicola]|uniref:helix-turn-helix transcriptional regulator n=1 Tax=Paraburkholderia sediminicola TaxID=458836 RepID=UPI0038BBD438